MIASFRDEAGVQEALRRLREAEVGPLETYTPGP